MRQLPLLTFLLPLLLCPAAALAAGGEKFDFQLGREYLQLPGTPVLSEGDDGRIEVLAFFWYNCDHCYRLEPLISAWADRLPADVRFRRLPVVFNPAVAFHARIFMTLRALGLGPQADMTVFRLFHEQRRPVNRPEDLPRLANSLKVNEKKLIETFNSTEVDIHMNQLDQLMLAYDLPGVPSMVIDGRYLFDIGTAHGPDGYLQLADLLIAEEREYRGRNGGRLKK
ncbi:MAG: thiol:disulfide interchange protein DsbA/DsbL [Candidatus Adiutrix sp.]|jgi:thiol:disulfide interchange protein DsbA|nr:thiol:disulfide interchange protein DsbA/DsbL [Candidatus Adiutrix sp.]